ncbi:hypothetical protein SLE2022_080550 [Rubroshorea leprosula]
MAEKHSHLNGAYYGPPVPPARSYHRHGHGSGCGCCCCCLLSFLIKLIVTAVIIVGLAALIFWLIFRPNIVKFHVTDASLTQFNLTSDNNLHYNVALNITVRNPNKKIGIYYDRIEANAYYEDQRFATQQLTPFYQGHKNTSYLNPSFQGQKLVLLGADGVSEYNQEKNSGVYSVDVKLNLRVRFKLGKLKTWRFKPKIECDLKVPLSSSAETTKCKIDFF